MSGKRLLHHRRRSRAAFERYLHRLRLLFLRLPVRGAAISACRQFRLARQDGQMHLLRRRSGTGRQHGGVREIRRQPSGRGQIALVRRNVLDQVVARRRWRDHRPNLQGAGSQARLRLRRLGLEDRLSRDHHVITRRREAERGGICVTAPVAKLRIIVGTLTLLWVAVCWCPVAAQQPESVDPTASAVNERQLLQQFKTIQGRGSIPDTKSYTIEQPAGRDWRHFREVTLRWIGGVAILGILALLVLFYLWRGMVRIESGRSGHTIVRFNAAERFVHWMTATCFVILALSGLNITFGRPLLLPLMSPEGFTAWSEWAKYAHNYLSFPFTLGVILIFFMWVAGNIPNRVDIEWF